MLQRNGLHTMLCVYMYSVLLCVVYSTCCDFLDHRHRSYKDKHRVYDPIKHGMFLCVHLVWLHFLCFIICASEKPASVVVFP